MRKLARILDEPVHPHAFGVVRFCLGVILLKGLIGNAQELSRGGEYFGDVFHMPFLAWLPEPSRSTFVAILATRILLAVLVVLGVSARLALGASGALGLYVFLLDRTQFHHNRYSLLLYVLLLAFAPVHRSVAWLAPTAPASERWPIYGGALAKLQVAIVYVASAGSKLVDADWRDGTVISLRLSHWASRAVERGAPRSVVEWLATPFASAMLSRGAITTELCVAFALFRPRLRVPAIWFGCMFHLMIEITSKVEAFTWLTLAMYGVFVTHDVGARTFHFDGSRTRGRVLARLVRLTDWFRRYDVQPWQPDQVGGKHVVVIRRRDGTRATGFSALVMAARTLPILFPLWAPLALLESALRTGDVNPRS